MESNECRERIPDYVLGKLTSEEEAAFLKCIESNEGLKAEFNDWREIQSNLDISQEPSSAMDDSFYDFLEKEVQKESEEPNTKGGGRVRGLFGSQLFIPLMAASVMLLFGLFLGKQWGASEIEQGDALVIDTQIQESKKETEDVRTQLVISLADQTSAARRLEAASEASKLNIATDKVIQALFKMLNEDDNVNVRLAAVNSLSKYVDNPTVREGLVMSIVHQDSPHVQIALAELMVTLKEKESIESIEELLNKPDTNEAVKVKLQESINQII